ncbi:MAG: hypothetical protein J5802_11960 [Butyrivibrio sp.]|nr:hypothetical protein [Butyrivibrio sp.]
MDIMYKWVIAVGAILIVVVCLILHSYQKKNAFEYTGGLRAANTQRIRSSQLYRALFKRYQILRTVLIIGLIGSMLAGVVLISRPYKTQDVVNGVKKRDIIICLDVSYSLYELNSEITEYLTGVVAGLEGDRIGVSIFNTSSVTYVPLTDDYDYVIQKLKELDEYFALQKEMQEEFYDKFDTYYDMTESELERFDELSEELAYYEVGTLYRADTRGSSLIGEGLGSALYSFPYIGESDRTRVIIMCTDNELNDYYPQIMDLSEASDACKNNKVTVFGIFPSEDKFYMPEEYSYERCSSEFKRAVEDTGGKFYVRTNAHPVSEIVQDIQKQEAMMVKVVSSREEVDVPGAAFIVLLLCLSVFCGAGLVLQK